MEEFEICDVLDLREQQIEEKLNKIISGNPDPFPFERLEKGKLLLKLIYEIKKHIDADEFILAGMKLRDLELQGLKVLERNNDGVVK